jgi:hypothetical protein
MSEIIDEFGQLEYLRNHDGFTFREKVKLLSMIRQKLVSESNMQSRDKLKSIMASKKQPVLLAIAGIEHKPAFFEMGS